MSNWVVSVLPAGEAEGREQAVALRNSIHVNTLVPKVPASFALSSAPVSESGMPGPGAGCSDKSLHLQVELERGQAQSLPAGAA